MSLSDQKTRARLNALEAEAREHPLRHRLRLIALVLVGYAYPFLLLILMVGLIAGLFLAAPQMVNQVIDGAFIVYVVALLGTLWLIVAALRAFFVKLPILSGQPLLVHEAPELREIVEEVRQKLGSPKIHHIHIDSNFNAAIAQRPRFGFWGPRTNYLSLGLPLLISITPQQLSIVIAHELGHLRGRHSDFGAWIYRTQQTWATLAAPLNRAGRIRQWLFGWFIKWYGNYFTISTLPLRRLHEYEADRTGAHSAGAEATAQTLAVIDLTTYRLGKIFWPDVLREAAEHPLPPADVMSQIATFILQAPAQELLDRWRRKELASRTPITSDHPCLVDRLASLDCRDLLLNDSFEAALFNSADASIHLLGESRQRIWAVINAQWKTQVIARWRYEHAVAKDLRKKHLADAKESADVSTPDKQWEQIRLQAEYARSEQSIEILQEFLTKFPDHAAANFARGRHLLQRDDDDAAIYLDRAARSTDFLPASLHMLLDYYREAGRDDLAEPIRLRIDDFERSLVQTKSERTRISRRDRLEPHDLSADKIREIRSILYQYPRITGAWIARKQVRHFTDKPCYVLAIQRRMRPLEDNRKADKFLARSLAAQIPVDCAVVIFKWNTGRLRNKILKVAERIELWM